MERQGPLEISLDPGDGSADAGERAVDLIWRVRITSLTEDEIRVEQPAALGRAIPLAAGTRLVASMTIGQNRWMFRTEVVGVENATGALRLVLPENVERCQRRAHFRMSTVELLPPPVECWPLLDPTSALPAEVANRDAVLEAIRTGQPPAGDAESALLPEVGPGFTGRLVNIGGGGLGLLVRPEDSSAAERHRLYWMRLHLTPYVPAPVGVTARVAHTHLDSSHNLYAGVGFEFAFHPAHKAFVLDQIVRYVTMAQRAQADRMRQAA